MWGETETERDRNRNSETEREEGEMGGWGGGVERAEKFSSLTKESSGEKTASNANILGAAMPVRRLAEVT